MGIGPVEAIPKVLKQAGLKFENIDLIELNEAFAAQSIAVIRELGLDPSKVNVNGGAIALGHPLGCTGSKLTATLLYGFDQNVVNIALPTLRTSLGAGPVALLGQPRDAHRGDGSSREPS